MRCRGRGPTGTILRIYRPRQVIEVCRVSQVARAVEVNLISQEVAIWESEPDLPAIDAHCLPSVYRQGGPSASAAQCWQISLARLDVLARFVPFEPSRSCLVDDRVDIDS